MNLTFRPEMKVIVHEVDGHEARVSGKTIDVGNGPTSFATMLQVWDRSDLKAGSRVRCSYVDPSGVHTFDSVVVAADPLALNHRLVRTVIAVPTDAERIQRRADVRVPYEADAQVERTDAGAVAPCRTIDLSAGGSAVLWGDDPLPDVGEEVQLRFSSEHQSHDLRSIVLGSHDSPAGLVVRLQFIGTPAAARDRVVAVVFAVQREELRRQRNSGSRR